MGRPVFGGFDYLESRRKSTGVPTRPKASVVVWPDDRVVVIEGPLRGFEGTVVEIVHRRLVISIHRGQKALLVELDQSWVTKATRPVQSSTSLDAH